MFGGFGRSDFADDDNNKVRYLQPRQINFAKQAFAALVWSQISHQNQIKDKVNELKHHYLYEFAFAQVENDKITPSQRYERVIYYIQTHSTLPFAKCLVKAVLFMKGLKPTEEDVEDEQFLEEYEKEAKRLIENNQTIPNNAIIAAHFDHLNDIINNIRYDLSLAQLDKDTRPYYKFCETLVENGLPSVEQVRSVLHEQDAQLYRNDLDMIENDQVKNEVDVDEALQNGAAKRWNDARVINRAISMVRTYCETLPMHNLQDAALHCQEWIDRHDRKNNERYKKQREVADTFGVWRIRHSQINRWRAYFDAQNADLEHYLRLEAKLKSVCRYGIYQHIQRRHISEFTIHNMFTTNFPRFRELFPDVH